MTIHSLTSQPAHKHRANSVLFFVLVLLLGFTASFVSFSQVQAKTKAKAPTCDSTCQAAAAKGDPASCSDFTAAFPTKSLPPACNAAGDPAACAAAAQQKVTVPVGCNANASQDCTDNGCDLISKYVSPAAEVLSASFGLIASVSIIIAAIQYSSSGGDPQKVSNAKKRLFSTIVAIVAYVFLFALLQFLIPGGVFQS